MAYLDAVVVYYTGFPLCGAHGTAEIFGPIRETWGHAVRVAVNTFAITAQSLEKFPAGPGFVFYNARFPFCLADGAEIFYAFTP